MAQPLTMTVKRVSLGSETGPQPQGRVECEKVNGPVQGSLVLLMAVADAGLFRPGDAVTLTYTKD